MSAATPADVVPCSSDTVSFPASTVVSISGNETKLYGIGNQPLSQFSKATAVCYANWALVKEENASIALKGICTGVQCPDVCVNYSSKCDNSTCSLGQSPERWSVC